MYYHYLMAKALRQCGIEDGALQEARIARVIALRLQANEEFMKIDQFLNEG